VYSGAPLDFSQRDASILADFPNSSVGSRKGNGYFAWMQLDNNLVFYNGVNPGVNKGPYWATGTNGWGGPLHATLDWNTLRLWDDNGGSPWPNWS
jgi:hypothetical protein